MRLRRINLLLSLRLMNWKRDGLSAKPSFWPFGPMTKVLPTWRKHMKNRFNGLPSCQGRRPHCRASHDRRDGGRVRNLDRQQTTARHQMTLAPIFYDSVDSNLTQASRYLARAATELRERGDDEYATLIEDQLCTRFST